MRIVSLLPSASDIVAALQGADYLVGVSHSCDARWSHLPSLTSTRIDKTDSPRDIDTQVKSSDAPLYMLDIDRLEELAPDLIITQELCDVCAVPAGDVRAAIENLSGRPELLTLSPFRLEDVADCFQDVAQATGLMTQGNDLQKQWQDTLARYRGYFQNRKPGVAFLDWLDPPFAAGHWVPDIIELTGCSSMLVRPGDPSREIVWDDVRHCGADIVMAACCGQDKAQAEMACHAIPDDIDVHLLDGDVLFSRPSPSLMDSIGVFVKTLENKI